MDLNIDLIFFVLISCIMMLAYTIFILKKDTTEKHTDWIIVYAAISCLTIISFFLIPNKAGYIGGVLWLIFIIFPSLGQILIQHYSFKEEYEKELIVSKIILLLHPAGIIKSNVGLTRVLILIRDGEIEAARQLLKKYQNFNNPSHRLAYTIFLSRTGKYEELIEWINKHITEANIDRYPELLPRYIEALGATGQIKKMLDFYANIRAKMSKQYFVNILALIRLYIFAFTGQTQLLEGMLSGKLSVLSSLQKTYWRAIALQHSGKNEEAHQQLTSLLTSDSYPIRLKAQLRLDSQPQILPQNLQPQLEEFIQHESQLLKEEKKYKDPLAVPSYKKRAWMTYALIMIILFYFLLQLQNGGSQDTSSLFRLGAMIKYQDQTFGWWRLFPSMFMHFDFMHLLMNLVALFLIGPFVERSMGAFRFLSIYFVSGLIAMFLATLLTPKPYLILLGASGCIMGLLGAMAYLLYQGYKKEKSKIAGESLKRIIFVFSSQVIFDILVPGVSMVAHMSGFVSGFIVTALLLAFKKVEPAKNEKS